MYSNLFQFVWESPGNNIVNGSLSCVHACALQLGYNLLPTYLLYIRDALSLTLGPGVSILGL